jgi:hypothetical protein
MSVHFAAASGSSLIPTVSDVFTVGRCGAGKYAAALGVSLGRNCLPSSPAMPTIWTETTELFLCFRATGRAPSDVPELCPTYARSLPKSNYDRLLSGRK